jgi:Carboxypeptidase regulatory-like domain/TonB dependent receptor
MIGRVRLSVFRLVSLLVILLAFTRVAQAQQTLGGITGTVTDSSGGVLSTTTVTIVGDQTKLTRTQQTSDSGTYDFVNLPIGAYTLTFTHDGFQTLKIPSITVQADRTATVNAALKVGEVGTTITVEESLLINAVDTTNGYILEKDQIESVPLPTGSFTGLAILSPGVNAELPGGTGVNAGQGNQPIWANGQRDTSNSFLLNGVDASNLFNGKSTSQVASARIVNNTGAANQGAANGVIQTAASPYLAIGQALPTPAPESIAELRVNTSMYDAQQGSTSGAHIDMSTASGSNDFHGSVYVHRGTNWLNAAPFFFNQDSNIPADQKVPGLHRYTAGGTLGGPIKKDKLFAFLSYQHTHVSDNELGISRLTVPHGLSDSNRTADGLATLANTNFGLNPPLTASNIDPIALALFQYKLPNGQFLIPNDTGRIPTSSITDNAIAPGTARFWSDQVVANLDWNASSKDTLQLKYYYQHDPTIAPYANSNVPGFDDHLDAGSHVASITNTQMLKPNLSVTETFGFLREKIYSTNTQLFTPQQLGINEFGSSFFPGISIVDTYGNNSSTFTNPNNPNGVFNTPLTVGPGAFSQNALTGVFQNRFMPSANAIWTLGKHTLTFGGSFSYTQLNVRDNRPGTGMIATPNFATFVQGLVTLYSPNGFVSTAYLQGDANRYYRANQTGTYVQDKFQLRSNLSVTAGLRFDWNGGLKEKYGRIYNFDPSQYSYDETSGTVTSTGFVIAGNNKLFPTKGVSDTTLTGRQWGLAPRVGVAWSPAMFHGKVVVRAGAGLYYDRGELFAYLSPGFAAGEVTGGPYGVNQAPPFVNSQVCGSTFTYGGFIPVCNLSSASLANPWGPARGPAPSGNPADIINFLPSRAAIETGAQVFPFAIYDRRNKLPYTINDTLDIQWQPRNDLAIEIGYVGNLGRHQVIPVPFNQAGIATPTNPIHGQQYTYGYQVLDPNTFLPISLPNGQGPFLNSYEGGNIDLRVPYVGYSAEAESYRAAGVSAYNALQTHIEKRLSHGLQVGFSYTYSHALDEQSAMGLFFTGNNPLNLRDGYASSDFDRTHVFNFNYLYQLPKFWSDAEWKGKLADGWAVSGIAVFQSGQPYSIVDFSGAVGSVFYGVSDGITNPIVPLGNGCTPKSAVTGSNGIDSPALNASCFAVPLLNPGDLNGAIPAGDTFETNFTTGQRNIFRQSWQKRTDISLIKLTKLTERFSMRFSFDVFNLTNTPSFDIPKADVTQNANFNGFPVAGSTLYNAPSGLGSVSNTIGGPRQIQMSLRLLF